MIEAVCWRQQIEVYEARPSEISKFFLGNAKQGGRANKKAATIKMCRLYGWDTVSDDAADALALFAYAEHTIAPQIGSRRHASAGRELPLHGTLEIPRERSGTAREAPGTNRDGVLGKPGAIGTKSAARHPP
jgi:hypothetical protein